MKYKLLGLGMALVMVLSALAASAADQGIIMNVVSV